MLYVLDEPTTGLHPRDTERLMAAILKLPVRSCLILAVQANHHELKTVEGLVGSGGEYHPLQQAMHDHHGLQCGYCTPGILMTMTAFLEQNAAPSEDEVREALSGNLCRCTGYQNIIDAVMAAAERMRG